MKIDWFFGPDKVPFELDDVGQLQSAVGIPFHGIVGLGMRDLLAERGVSPRVWLRHAHRLFDGEEVVVDGDADERTVLQRCAEDADALSFADSAAVLRTYLSHHCTATADAECAEAWNLKEGHTSSVWKVVVEDGTRTAEFVVNVGRDRGASDDLQRTSERMRAIQETCPDINMAAVLDIASVSVERANGSTDVIVTQNEWVPDAAEIHALGGPNALPSEYVLVERFLTAADSPAEIVSIYGRRFTEDENRRIDHDLMRFLHAARMATADAPAVDLDHGDLVWSGRGAVVVAIS